MVIKQDGMNVKFLFIEIHLQKLTSKMSNQNCHIHMIQNLMTDRDILLTKEEPSRTSLQSIIHFIQLQDNQEQPTQQEIDNCILQIQKQITNQDITKIFQTLYLRFYNKNQLSERDHSVIAQTNDQDNSLNQDEKQQVNYNKPQFQIREIIQKIKPKRQKAQDREWLKDKPQTDKDKIISGEIWERYRYRQDRTEKISIISKGNKIQPQQNLIKALSWDYSTSNNRQHRLYANKIAPRFNNKDEEHKFYEKRLAAKAFCEKIYGKDKQYFDDTASFKNFYNSKSNYLKQNGYDKMDIKGNKSRYSSYAKNVKSNYSYSDKRRYKTVSIAFVSQAFRKLQLFIMQHVDKKIRPLTGAEIRELYSILLNAQHVFSEQQFDTFRKFVKITFDLGSVSVYQLQSKCLYRCIQQNLNEKMNQNKQDNKSVVSDWPIPWIGEQDFQNMYPYAQSVACSDESLDRLSKYIGNNQKEYY